MAATQAAEAVTGHAQPDALRVNDFCGKMSISPSTFWKAVRQKEIRTIKICGRTLVPASELDRLLAGRAA